MAPRMSPCLLLVHDSPEDAAVVAEVAALLGMTLVHAQPAKECLRLFGAKLPAWVLLCPGAAGGRGAALLAELKRHPYGGRTRFLLLGDAPVAHGGTAVEPLPLQAPRLLARLRAPQFGAAPGGGEAGPTDAVAQGDGEAGVVRGVLPGGDTSHGTAAVAPSAAGVEVIRGPRGSTADSGVGERAPWATAASGPGRDAVPEGVSLHVGPASSVPVPPAPTSVWVHGRASVISLPPRLEPGAGEEPLGAFARRLSAWAEDARLQRLHLEDDTGRGRWLWLEHERVVAAASTLPAESLLERARLDGLVTASELTALQELRRASAAEQLAALRARGWVREEESAPLLSRHLRAVALEALSAPRIRFERTQAEQVPGDVPRAGEPVPVLALVVESLRRKTAAPEVLERVGGVGARLRVLPHAFTVAELELSPRESAWVEGFEATGGTLEALLLGAGVRQEAALSLLAALEVLGAVEFLPPELRAPSSLGVRELERLAAKRAEVASADYFQVLGLPRDAGTGEVLRAWETLRAEFEPLKYVGHPDVGLTRDAQEVCAVLDEAMKALRDDRLRAAYARYLVG